MSQATGDHCANAKTLVFPICPRYVEVLTVTPHATFMFLCWPPSQLDKVWEHSIRKPLTTFKYRCVSYLFVPLPCSVLSTLEVSASRSRLSRVSVLLFTH